MKTWVKICANTNLVDALVATEAGADCLGFVFCESKRKMTPEAAREVVSRLPKNVQRAGVFVNEPLEKLLATAKIADLDVLQLHGEEDAEYVHELRKLSRGRLIIKGLRVSEDIVERAEPYVGYVDALLLDSGANGERGGTGKSFDWFGAIDHVARLEGEIRVIIAGGLTPANVAGAIGLFRPWGVDVATGVEARPGIKDPGRVHDFVHAVRRAEERPEPIP